MKTSIAPLQRARFPAADGQYLTPTGWAIGRALFRLRRCIPFVTMRRYLVTKLERDRMIHDLHMMAIRLNRSEAELSRLRKATDALKRAA